VTCQTTKGTKIRVNFIGWRNFTMSHYKFHCTIVWMTQPNVPQTDIARC